MSTMPEIYRPLMDGPSIVVPWCVVCGRSDHVERHHYVWRSWGQLYGADGRPMEKPVVTLCGFGNTSGCHGRAHRRELHFRVVDGELEYIQTPPCSYAEALEMDGWRRI